VRKPEMVEAGRGAKSETGQLSEVSRRYTGVTQPAERPNRFMPQPALSGNSQTIFQDESADTMLEEESANLVISSSHSRVPKPIKAGNNTASNFPGSPSSTLTPPTPWWSNESSKPASSHSSASSKEHLSTIERAEWEKWKRMGDTQEEEHSVAQGKEVEEMKKKRSKLRKRVGKKQTSCIQSIA
jgi:hypothetical protein